MNYEHRSTTGGEAQFAIEGEKVKPSRKWWWIIGTILVVVLAAGVAFMAFGSGAKSGADASSAKAGGASDSQMPTVTVIRPGRSTIQKIVSGTGSLAARREMPVGVAGEGGEVTSVLVEPGDWVGAGQVLAVIDRSVQTQTAASLSAQIRVARADAVLAQSELDRANSLVDRGFISKADIDRKTATLDAAVARVRVAEATLGEASARTRRLDIRAPAAGLVLTRAVEPGQIVSSGSGTLFRMAKGGEMELRAQLSESDLAGLAVGVPAEVTPVGSAKLFKGQVWQVSPVIDPQSRQGIARIALAYDSLLRPGGFASARIIAGASVAPQLPQSAVQSDSKGNYVYLIDDKNQAVRRDIVTGAVSDQGVAITSGLDGSERVVATAGAFLSPGQKVIPQVGKKAQ